jgi:WD40 repeat protein
VLDRAGKRTVLAKDLLSVMGLAWSPHGREVWFTGTRIGASRELRAVDLDGLVRLLLRAPGALRLFDVSNTGEILVDRVDYRARTTLHRKDQQQRDLSWLDGTSVNDCVGGTLLFSESWDGAGAQYGLYVRSLDGGAATRIGDGQGGSMSPDHKWVSLFRVTPDGGRRLSGAGRRGEEEGHGQVDQRAVVSRWQAHTLVDAGNRAIHDLATNTQKPAFPGSMAGFSYVLSPDAALLAAQAPDHQLSLFAIGGTSMTPIPNLPPHAFPLQFSPDGTHLIVAVGSSTSATATIYDVDLKTKKAEHLMLRQVVPADPAGVTGYVGFCTSDLGQSVVTTHLQVLSTLYQMSNID